MTEAWWCATLIIYSSVKDPETGMFLCDEQIRILRAETADSALIKAFQIGKAQEHSYESIDGHIVSWIFAGVRELEEISDERLDDGTEIKSKLMKVLDLSELLSYKAPN